MNIEANKIIFNVNEKCNSKCIYCPVWKSDKVGPSFIEYKKILNDAITLNVRQVVLSGGEPLLKNNLEEYIEYSQEKSLYTILVTNGILLSKSRLNSLISAGVSEIQVSIDSLNSAIYKKIRGIDIENVLGALNYLVKIRAKTNLKVVINCVLNPYNIDSVMDLVSFSENSGFNFQVQPIHYYGSNQFVRLNGCDQDIIQIIQKLINSKEEGYKIQNSVEYLTGIPLFYNEKLLPNNYSCRLAESTIVVDADLNLLGCWQLTPIENLLKQSLVELWYGEKMNKIRKKMNRLDCPGCYLMCT